MSAPLRRLRPATPPATTRHGARVGREQIDLEAARDAKYREIRDAELDHQTGKLSDADYEAIDSTLRPRRSSCCTSWTRSRSRRPRRARLTLDDDDPAATPSSYHQRAEMTFVLDIVQVFVSIMLVVLVLMHSGKDAGLSGPSASAPAAAARSAAARWSSAT